MRFHSAAGIACTVLATALIAAGCGDDDDSGTAGGTTSAASGDCQAKVGLIMPITGPVPELGGEELNFAKFGIDKYNEEHGTKITYQEGDTQASPAQATTVVQQFVADSDVVALVSGITSGEITAIGPHLTRAGLPIVASGTTKEDLTNGKIPTFFRLAAKNSVQAETVVKYIQDNMDAKQAVVIDDQSAFSVDVANEVQKRLDAAGLATQRESISQKQSDFSSIASKIGDDVDIVYTPWTVARSAHKFGENLKELGKKAVIFGGDGLFSPGQFEVEGAFVASFAPDITQIPASKDLADEAEQKYGKFGTFGPPVFSASQVVAGAIDRVCQAGEKPSRENVLAEIKETDESASILGQPLKFTPSGDLEAARFFLFKIDTDGAYQLVE